MAIGINYLRNPYRPGTGPVIAPWIRPQRHNLLTFRRYWPGVSMGTICLLLLLATLPLQHRWRDLGMVLLVAAGYSLAAICFDLADHWSEGSAWQQRLRGWRKLVVVLGLTVLHWFWPAAATDLWLLYLIPLITVGVDLDRCWATVLIVVTSGAMFLSAWPMPDLLVMRAEWATCLLNGLIRAILGIYLGMTGYLLARALAYQTNTTRKVLGNLLNVTIADRWLNTADTVAHTIANLLTETHNKMTMNVFVYETAQDQIRLVGSSTKAGQGLAGDGFAFHAAQGITGWAAQENKPCFINNTAHDPEARFLATAAFSGTRSALAMPLQLDEDHAVVLEIESTVPYDVAHEDLQLLSHAGHYLINAHQRSTLLTFHQQLVQLGTTLADRIIHVHEIGPLLEEIGTVALELLDADVIRFYFRNPESDRIDQRCTIGKLQQPPPDHRAQAGHPVETLPTDQPHHLVMELLAAARLCTFTEAQHDPLLCGVHGDLNSDLNSDPEQCQPFVIREGIQSCAAMPLIVGQEKLGLMWVNYRKAQPFSPLLESAIQLLAPYAALAIKSGIQTALNERQRRIAMRRIVHDSLAHRLHDVTRGLERLDHYEPTKAAWKEERLIVQRQVERARRVVNNLINERHWLTLQSVIDDLETHAQLIEKYYKFSVQTIFGAMPETNISIAGGNELMYACDEILGNVVRHSQAAELSITAEIEQDQLRIYIADNGVGFDTSTVRLGQGIASIRDRIQRMNGTVDVTSAPWQGTLVYLEVPLNECNRDAYGYIAKVYRFCHKVLETLQLMKEATDFCLVEPDICIFQTDFVIETANPLLPKSVVVFI